MLLKEGFSTKNIVFVLLTILVILFIFKIKVIALLFFAGYIIACALNPIVNKLSTKMSRQLATTIALSAMLLIILLFFIPLIIVAVKQIQAVIILLPDKLSIIQNYVLNKQIFGYRLLEFIKIDQIINSAETFTTSILNHSIDITKGIAQGIIFFLAICMIVFYIVVDKEALKNYYEKLFPDKMKHRADEILKNISQKVGGFVIAQILTMLAVGVITTIFLIILRIDYAVLLGLMTGVLDIIPIIGPTIALIACLVVAYHINPILMIFVLVAFLAAQWISNNIVRPIVFGKFLDLHPLVIIFALLIGAQFLGVWGVILAPAIVAMLGVLFDELYIKTINKNK